MDKFSHLAYATKVAIDRFLKGAMAAMENQKSTEMSDETQEDYLRLAKYLLTKRSRSNVKLQDIVGATHSKNTFYKRIAALRHYVVHIGSISVETLIEKYCPVAEHNIKNAANDIHELLDIVKNGMQSARQNKQSKRAALRGLPSDWVEQLCGYNKKSKYSEALIVSALTGCRPSELQKGIRVSYNMDKATGSEQLEFKIPGSKVTPNSGQVWRTITYQITGDNQLISSAIEIVKQSGNTEKTISITSPVNFTHEVRRIAKRLWPDHKKPVTAYCFRHQFAANLKQLKAGDDTSKALGHRSSKTRRLYGTAAQARGSNTHIIISASSDLSNAIEKPNDGVEP
jgi:integrase